MSVANKDHQHTPPFEDSSEIEQLPEELRQVARRYATLPAPRPTSEETSRLIARLQNSADQQSSHLPMRSQQRRWRARPLLEVAAAILLVGLLSGGFLLVTSLRSHRSPLSPAATASVVATSPAVVKGRLTTVQALHMFDAMNGWALTGTSILITTNGWSTWKDVTPHRAGLVVGGYFLSSKEAWIAQSEQQPGAIVSHTTDGGQTWQSATLSANVPIGPIRMSFINNADGWAEGETGGATGNDLEIIFRTTNGGKSWTAVSRTSYGGHDNIPATFPFSGHKTGLTFINATTGWATGPWLYVTRDGGATWHQQILPTSPGQVFAPPTFFNTRNGIVLAGSQLFSTHDGGITWQPGSPFPTPSGVITFIDLKHGWAVADEGTAFFHTNDGGVRWARIAPGISASITSVVQLDFVSTEIGWALGFTSDPTNTLLFKTTDGGQHWRQVP